MKKKYVLIWLSLSAFILVGCSGHRASSGKYYQDDGPGNRQVDIDSIPNAVPKYEPYRKATSKPYVVGGKRYVPLSTAKGYVAEGEASWYGKKYHGRQTAIGERYDMYAMTAAHPTLPLPSYARVTNLRNQRSIIVRLNDRGPFLSGRIIDLSYVAAQKLGIAAAGTGRVLVESVFPGDESRAVVETVNPVLVPASPSATDLKSNSGSRWLQVGAFSSLYNADKLKNKLLSLGYERTQIIKRDYLHKVVIGPILSNEAEQLMRTLWNHGFVSTHLTN